MYDRPLTTAYWQHDQWEISHFLERDHWATGEAVVMESTDRQENLSLSYQYGTKT